ncbi:hypothetical protein EV360DRAFT_77087, partial [Lentinula raphanica]
MTRTTRQRGRKLLEGVDKDSLMAWTRMTQRRACDRLDGGANTIRGLCQINEGRVIWMILWHDASFPGPRFFGYEHDKSQPIPTSACMWQGSLIHWRVDWALGSPISQSTTTLLLSATDIATAALSGAEETIPITASKSSLSSPGRNIITNVSPGCNIDANVSSGRNIDANVSSGCDVDANVSSGCNVDANVLPDRNVNANISPGLNITVESIRLSFLQFLAANQLLDSAAIAAGFSDSFVEGLVYCLVGHGIGIRQLTGTHDLERTIIMQQLDEAQVAQAAAETAWDSMQSFVDAAAAHQDQCEQELQELRLKYHQLEEQLDDANMQLATARGEVDFTTAQNTLMEDENARLENDNDRLVEDRKVLTSQNEVLFKSLLSHQETLEYLLKKDSPAEVLHELGRSKEELERVQRDLELSRSSVQTLQETISLHLDTISVKDEQIY